MSSAKLSCLLNIKFILLSKQIPKYLKRSTLKDSAITKLNTINL